MPTTTIETYLDGRLVSTETVTIPPETVTIRLRMSSVISAVPTLRTWASDAAATTVTPGNSVAVLQTVVNRLGVFFSRFADLVENS